MYYHSLVQTGTVVRRNTTPLCPVHSFTTQVLPLQEDPIKRLMGRVFNTINHKTDKKIPSQVDSTLLSGDVMGFDFIEQYSCPLSVRGGFP